jgi:membrane-bound lytic murein transglycosylase B
VFASIANYLGQSGWRLGEPWGQQVMLTRPIGAAMAGRGNPRTLGEWQQAGVRRIDGTPFSRSDVRGALLLPDGGGGEAFLVYRNFDAIRRYNPSDFYALAVGLLGDEVS